LGVELVETLQIGPLLLPAATHINSISIQTIQTSAGTKLLLKL